MRSLDGIHYSELHRNDFRSLDFCARAYFYFLQIVDTLEPHLLYLKSL